MILKKAERLARVGFALHWLKPRSKAPIGNDWADKPVASVEKLRQTYKAGYNVGIRTGKYSKVNGQFLHLIDMDVRNPHEVDTARARLKGLLPGVDLRDLPSVISGSGGGSRHFYFLTDKPFTSKKLATSIDFSMIFDPKLDREVKKYDWEIELFGTGKQAVLPPSIHPDTGREYVWERPFNLTDIELGEAPYIPAETIERAVDIERRHTSDTTEPPLDLTRREIRRILDKLDINEWCEDRDGWLHVGMALHHETNGSAEGYLIWKEFSEQSEKFNDKDQRAVWRSFDEGRRGGITMRSLRSAAREAEIEAQFENLDVTEPLEEDEPEDNDIRDYEGEDGNTPKRLKALRKDRIDAELGEEAPPRIAAFNKKHAVARIAGKTAIINFESDGTVSYATPTDLNNLYANDRVTTQTGSKPASQRWMEHPKRRTYLNGVVFRPNGNLRGAFNLWRGFAIERDSEASCKLIRWHMKHILCRGDNDAYDYLIGWLAHLVQHPEDKPGVAVVVRGKKGVGKDTVGYYIKGLFPVHYQNVSHKEHFLGKFNAHVSSCLLLHVEEAFWAGDRRDDGILKSLITAETMTIEPKGVNAFQVDSYLRLFMSSNEKWVVPATEDERRYFVLDASVEKKGDHAYFAALREEMNNGGREALLDFLLNVDLSDFNVRDVPGTEALGEQKLAGLRNFPKWFYGCLQNGDLDLSMHDEDGGNDWTAAWIKVSRNDFRDSYIRWLKTRRYDGDEIDPGAMGRALKELCPSIESVQPRTGNGARQRFYHIPPLDECREAFGKWIGASIDWGDRDI